MFNPNTKIRVQFYTLTGKFGIAKTEEFETVTKAKEAIAAYATANGYTNVQSIDDEDGAGLRFTAKTPGGRSGRNIAQIDF